MDFQAIASWCEKNPPRAMGVGACLAAMAVCIGLLWSSGDASSRGFRDYSSDYD